jgi:predicted O-methyltransferase YrrM
MHSLESENSEICREIEEEAIASYVPIIRKEMESFLKVMLTIKRPERILEVGQESDTLLF